MTNELTKGYHRFRQNRWPSERAEYEALAANGQKPHTLVVACSDSRADPALIFDTAPGELFVVRNVANLVPPYEPDGKLHGVSAALEFGVNVLKVRHIVVMGHASCGGVNAMHDSFSPLGGLVTMWMIQLGEVVFGGVGTGLAGLVAYTLVAVFVAGLMVGRSPEYLGKKIEASEMKMGMIVLLVPPIVTLIGTAAACMLPAEAAAAPNPGPHGVSELLYAFSSAGNNNGSAFGGLSATSAFWTLALAAAMLASRLLTMLPLVAIGGLLAAKRTVAESPGTLPTHTPLFVLLVAGAVILVGALSFVPALALGPIAEALQPPMAAGEGTR